MMMMMMAEEELRRRHRRIRHRSPIRTGVGVAGKREECRATNNAHVTRRSVVARVGI